MNIEEFFELSSGKWFSHRTSNHLDPKESEGGKSDIVIETLPSDNSEVIKLCEKYQVEPTQENCCIKITWNGTTEWDKEKKQGSTVLVAIPDRDNPSEGRLLREVGDVETTPVKGTYKLGSDDSLTLIMEYANIWSEERLWFASPNLRMRVATIKSSGDFSMASFTSEIRMGGSPSAKKANDTAANAAS